MSEQHHYVCTTALRSDGKTELYVIVDDQDSVHVASRWLRFLQDVGRSPNTVKQYGSRLAKYLTYTALTSDWRAVSLAHLAMWRNDLFLRPAPKTNGTTILRASATVDSYLTSVRAFYEWADNEGLLLTDVASRMTQIKYFPPGTVAGGEYGARRRVLAEQLRPVSTSRAVPPKWISDAEARKKLEELDLNVRERLLLDLMYFTGIRIGEALSLLTEDVHFGGSPPNAECTTVDPHFHVYKDKAVENKARAKGCERMLEVSEHLVERYIDYVLERNRLMGHNDRSTHVFINLYDKGPSKGRAMSYHRAYKIFKRWSQRIDFDLSGPHTLRHTLATRLLRGIDVEPQPMDVVQNILGHASITSTRIYSHGLEEAKKAALLSVPSRTLPRGYDF